MRRLGVPDIAPPCRRRLGEFTGGCAARGHQGRPPACRQERARADRLRRKPARSCVTGISASAMHQRATSSSRAMSAHPKEIIGSVAAIPKAPIICRCAYPIPTLPTAPLRGEGALARRRYLIHGQPNAWRGTPIARDWTDGCIALANPEIKQLWDIVPDGIPITIRPRKTPMPPPYPRLLRQLPPRPAGHQACAAWIVDAIRRAATAPN